ncbi:hypothetical protein Rhow_007664 [Rhodococcus wratislaviensis]|uniref:Uncharacterized protein n=1 Tax=Rhodococcus wratislaviensis TaxID=44752 RepID=A0A402CIJ8_RHOWR|nr:hypothetical protein Rhow_007664 [Rhodococcus wratislaviensis]
MPTATRLCTGLATLEESGTCLGFRGVPVALQFASVRLNGIENDLPVGACGGAVALSLLERELA